MSFGVLYLSVNFAFEPLALAGGSKPKVKNRELTRKQFNPPRADHIWGGTASVYQSGSSEHDLCKEKLPKEVVF